jgi:hypothetical protein
MRKYRKPDVKGPRYRKTVHNVLNSSFLEEFKTKYPNYRNIDNKKLKSIIDSYNGVLWQMIIDEREGVELPEGLGFLFIGTATAKSENPNPVKSAESGVALTHMNWQTNNRICKIFYTNYPSKYRFANREVWTFMAVRQFKRSVSKAYVDNWERYIVIDNLKKISHLYRKMNNKFYDERNLETLLESYDEFKID